MDEEAQARLSSPHALALRLAELGAEDGLIAECLHIEPEAVGPLVAVARAKLVDVETAETGTGRE